MHIAFDTSALVKRYVHERGTPRVLELCAKATEITFSVLCVPETLSALNRLRREKRLSSDEYDMAKGKLAADTAHATVTEISSSLLSRTTDVLESTTLRALDAIQVATAIESRCDLFVSADAPQCEAAVALGLRTELIR